MESAPPFNILNNSCLKTNEIFKIGKKNNIKSLGCKTIEIFQFYWHLPPLTKHSKQIKSIG